MTDRKQALQQLKQELTHRIDKIDADLHSRNTSAKFSEQVVGRQNDDVLRNLKNEAMSEVEQIDNALLKIERDIYGTCEKCHNLISHERLDAIPFATLCKNCAA